MRIPDRKGTTFALIAFTLTASAFTLPSIAQAQVTVDQSQVTAPVVGLVISVHSPIGQEFVPTLSALNFVDLQLEQLDPADSLSGGSFFVRIRQGTISNAVLSTSALVTLENGFGAGGSVGGGDVRFEFSSLVPLTPGSTYVFELVQQSGDDWLVYGAHGDEDPYPNGRLIAFGVAGNPLSSDMYFREGITLASSAAAPEPATIALVGMGLLPVVGAVIRRRRSSNA